ncbi:MAG TPA: histidine kinase dimerization/phosphoacceptor domain-containing protein [Gaiellaceae bacterium]|nr:histidine kinase dimerization/phosphoacceptor domain-containing protein [Gaiellaceae bacterium]
MSKSETDELRASRTRLVTAADDERRAIERELHNGVMQDLVALGVGLQLARGLVDVDSEQLADLLGELLRNVHDALDAVRRLSLRVYPSPLNDGDLGGAIRAAAATAGDTTTVDVAATGGCSREVAASIYFCCVRLLEDAAADGHDAAIRVRSEETTMFFEVTVKGADFEHWAMRDLRSLNDRLCAFGGFLTVAEADGGVRISGQAVSPEPSSASAR